MVPVGFVVSHHLLKHGLDDFIDHFHLAIAVGILRRWELVFEIQHGWKFFPQNIFEVLTMVEDYLLGNAKSWNDMVKEKLCRRSIFAIECVHGLVPLSEVINNHNNVFMSGVRGRSDFHEINHPLAEGTDCDHEM